MSKIDAFSNDKFLQERTEKVLCEAFEDTGRYGKFIGYRAAEPRAAVARIGAPLEKLVIPNVNYLPTISVIDLGGTQPEPSEAESLVNIVKENRPEVGKRAIKKTKADQQDVTDPEPPKDIFTFKETYEQTNRINPALPAVGSNRKINDAELRAFVWYMEQVGRKMSRKWYDLAGYRSMDADGEVDIKEWMRQGVLWYYKGDYLPSYAYFSGNLYDKKSALDNDRDAIIELYGEDVYQAQKDKFEQLFTEKVYNTRLKINPETIANQLVLLPNSEFARTFVVETLDTGEEFKGPKFSDNEANRKKGKVGKPDWTKVGGRHSYRDESTVIESMSIRDAFQFWMRYAGGDKQIKKNQSWLDIINYYLEPLQYNKDREGDRTSFTRKKAIARQEGERLFMVFIKTQLKPEDILRIETQWNRDNNAIVETDFDKIPVAFEYAKEFYNSPMDVRWEKREAVSFMTGQGSGLLAFQVGMGKSLSFVMSALQFIQAGWCKRPFLVVPNQTYKQWIAEIHNLNPNIKINDYYNLGTDYIAKMKDEKKQIMKVDEGSITIFTYEGFSRLGFSEATMLNLRDELAYILDQNDEGVKNEKEKIGAFKKVETLLGKGLSGTMVEIESLGLDFMCVDEAHSMKKIFTRVAGKSGEKNDYEISSGTPSNLGLKGFCIAQYIQRMNEGRNVMLLTATPFTNSPLEVYSMLSLIGYAELKRQSKHRLKDFFDTYCDSSYELVISAKMNLPERKLVFLGWNNLQALQKLVFQFMNYKEGDHLDEKGRIVKQDRPIKYVIPYEKILVDGIMQELDDNQRIKSSLSLTVTQKTMMEEIKSYVVSGTLPGSTASYLEDDDPVDEDEEIGSAINTDDEVDYSRLKADEKEGVRIMQGVGWARSVALSPYLYMYSTLGKPTYLEYVESSPKIHYIMQCVANVRKYHLDKKEPVSGQIIYMDRGKVYFELLKEYLVKVVGYNSNEIGIIRSGMKGGKGEKERIKNLFNGERYDEAVGKMIPVPDDERIKIVIGSRSIREGLNLQKKTSCLYQGFIDWNPTDEVQLEGRAWRQGNIFKAIRIVIPLMIDSMDIFMFQKLEEKTSRINAIWNRDGKTSIIKLEEFDPKEQKYNLITDPEILARMEVDDMEEQLDEDKSTFRGQQEVLKNIKDLIYTIKNYHDEATKIADFFRPKLDKEGNKLFRSDAAVVTAIDDVLKRQTDETGKLFKDRYGNGWHSYTSVSGIYINNGEYDAPYWYKNWKLAVVNYAKKEREVLQPNHIDPDTDAIKFAITKIDEQITDLDNQIKLISGPDAMKQRIEEVRMQQEKRKIGKATPEMRSTEFNKLNYLLSEVKVLTGQQKTFDDLVDPKVCPPKDKDGKLRIDKEALIQLEQCISLYPDTKIKNLVTEDVYTDKRQELHNKIIYDLYKHIACLVHDQPICVITAGPPGSGKSYFLKKFAPYMLSDKIITIDADAIRAKLPEYRGWNANATHHEAKDIVNEALSFVSTPCKHDLLYDGTMNKPENYLPLIGKLKTLGYKIFIVFVEATKELSRKRVLERYQKTGRYVPLSVIDEFYSHTPSHFDHIKTIVDGWIDVDGETAKILERSGEPIPQDREYFTQNQSTFPVEPEIVERVAEEAQTVADLKIVLKGAQSVVEYLEGEEKSDMEIYIRGLKSLIEIM